MKLLPIILIAIFCESLGGAMLSRGMKQVGDAVALLDLNNIELLTRFGMAGIAHFSPLIAHYLTIVLLTVTNFSFLSGLLLQITFFLLYLTLLSRADLSFVIPVTSFSYVITAMLAFFMLRETISFSRWCGIMFICTGVLLVSRGESITGKEKKTEVMELERQSL
jgi:drug/metabolite transporter (DMT)-like permease